MLESRDLLQRRIEEVSLNCWPALQQVLFDGWIIRFAQGYTKRANSVTPLYEEDLTLPQKVQFCEWFYRQKKLPAIFRLTSFSSPDALERFLENRGYLQEELSLVEYLSLAGKTYRVDPTVELRIEELDDWLNIVSGMNNDSLEQMRAHKAILETISTRRFTVSLRVGNSIVSCGLGVLEKDCFGLFDLVTQPERRNQGYGRKLVEGMLCWAQQDGATQAFLQVLSDNLPALHLYEGIGFKELYRYWYRVCPNLPSAKGT